MKTKNARGSSVSLIRHAGLLGMALALAVAWSMPATAAECGWLATGEVDRLFPENAPWRVTAGGAVGRCQFLSRPDQLPNVFSANQMIHDSEKAAAETFANLRSETSKSYQTKDRPQLGASAFSYSAGTPDGAAPRAMNFVAHRGRVVVLAMVSLQPNVTEARIPTVLQLVEAALSVADDPAALASATDCPWFEASLLASVLPGGGVTQQKFGDTSCMAKDGANAVLLVSATPASPALMGRRDGSCTWDDQPDLGAGAALGYSCSSGNPRATLRMVVGGTMLDYNLTPGSEPTEDQRRALVALARAVAARLEP
jgi:hypothetical protein